MKVYIPIKQQQHDYSAATEFGELVFISERPIRPFDVGKMLDLWRDHIIQSSQNDYIMVVGLASFLAVGAALFASKHNRLNLLFHDKGEYMGSSVTTKET